MAVVISTHAHHFFCKPFVYYPIEKCASTWITGICLTLTRSTDGEMITGGYNIYEDQSRIFYEKSFGVPKTNLPTAQTLHYYYSKLFLKNAFQFTFVRHPLDRFISSWIHGSISPEIGNFTNRFNSTMSTDEMILFFNKFVNSFVSGENGSLSASPHFGKYLSCLPKNIEDLDFIGKIENFNNDMEYVINIIWESDKEMSSKFVSHILSAADENVRNTENLHNTKRFRRGIPFEEFYSIESKKIISNYYKEELELFGYE